MDADDIIWAIACAEHRISKLSDDVRKINGLSTGKIRMLINNLCSVVKPLSYLEVGVWFGATFVSAMYGNSGRFVGIDNFSQFDEEDKEILKLENPAESKRNCIQSIINNFGNGNAVFYEEDAFSFDISKIQDKVTVFLYDGSHSEEDQKNGVLKFSPCLADETILMVDDYRTEGVKEGTQVGIAESGFGIIREWELFSGEMEDLQQWRNGFYVAMLRRL